MFDLATQRACTRMRINQRASRQLYKFPVAIYAKTILGSVNWTQCENVSAYILAVRNLQSPFASADQLLTIIKNARLEKSCKMRSADKKKLNQS